jgi:hypothetical protein
MQSIQSVPSDPAADPSGALTPGSTLAMPAEPSAEKTLTVVITGDTEMDARHYLFVAGMLCSLLAEHLPHVRVLTGGCPGADALVERWAVAHNLRLERFQPPRPPVRRTPEVVCVEWLLDAKPDGVVVFERRASDLRLSELTRLAHVRDIRVRCIPVPKSLDAGR